MGIGTSGSNKFLSTVDTRLDTFGALRNDMLDQQSPHHAVPTLALIVHILLGAHTLVTLVGLPAEFTDTHTHKITLEAAFRAILLPVGG